MVSWLLHVMFMVVVNAVSNLTAESVLCIRLNLALLVVLLIQQGAVNLLVSLKMVKIEVFWKSSSFPEKT